MPTRAQMWEKLDREVDLLVIGGGINGAGIARDAVQRGLEVALVEMKDLAYGTSSRSSKLIHGGLRYLEQYEFSLVFESVTERRIVMDQAPHLVNPLGFIFPVYSGSRHRLWVINAGMWLYDGLSLFRSPKVHRKLRARDVAEEEPALRTDGLQGAPLYYDCATDDARLTLENALDAAHEGATVATYCRLESFVHDDDGRVVGARVRDALGGEERELRAKVCVNATGPWTDQTIALSGGTGKPLLRLTKGAHVVVDHAALPVRHAVVCFHPKDERVLFAIPWGDRTYVGTTDTDWEGDAAQVHATREDVDYLLDAANHYFPRNPLRHADVIATWAGIRPLMAPPGEHREVAESAVSREHQIVVGEDGLVTVAGGKLTTYRRMAAETVTEAIRCLEGRDLSDRMLHDSRTERTPLPGAVGWPADDDHARVAAQVAASVEPALPADVARNLADTYGMRALGVARLCAGEPALRERLVEGRPEILAQVDWAALEELAATVDDVLSRRTQLFHRDRDQGLGAAPRVAERLALLLGWDDATRERHLEAYRHEVALSRRWREG